MRREQRRRRARLPLAAAGRRRWEGGGEAGDGDGEEEEGWVGGGEEEEGGWDGGGEEERGKWDGGGKEEVEAGLRRRREGGEPCDAHRSGQIIFAVVDEWEAEKAWAFNIYNLQAAFSLLALH